MNTIKSYLLTLLLLCALQPVTAFAGGQGVGGATWSRPELEYLKAVNQAGPPRDPQLLFLLMGQYLNANLQREGVEFISKLEQEFEPRLTDVQKSLYFSAIALLRAGHAQKVSLLKRISWVRDTIAMLDNAKRLSSGDVFAVRWASGVVSAQLPGFFDQRDTALADLTWCLEHQEKAPHAGWLREVYFQLAALSRQSGDTAQAEKYLQRSGYTDYTKTVTLTTPFAEELLNGHTFSPQAIKEIVPGRVFALSGFEFTEYYFVVSADGRELIAIDAGTRPDSARAAYEALRAYAPGLPPLTTVLVTHAHWDHIGGHLFFRGLEPRPRFYARGNYREEIARESGAPNLYFKFFFGSRFNMEDIKSFHPDMTIDTRTELRIGGSSIEIIPVAGGETHDGMFLYFPEHGVLFVGDFIMPYLGAPFLEEGDLQGLLDAIDIVVQKHPRFLLHGHEPLTRVFASPVMLGELKHALVWLRQEVLESIQQGAERASIQQANLIPPGLLNGNPDAHLPYLVLRENVINRLYDQHTGYWQPDLQGMDYLGLNDRGTMLVEYLGVSEQQLVAAAERMIRDGKYELAAAMLQWTRGRFPGSSSLAEVERLTYLKLMEKYQEFNPFKFILYSGKINFQTPRMESQPAQPGRK